MAAADRMFWLHALTPLHVGTGRGEGYIDLPLAREKATRLPLVPGSAVKGVFADAHGASQEKRKEPVHIAAFGTAGNDSAQAGSLIFTDARLVCLPVRSLYGTFAWCTSRFVLKRLARDFEAAGVRPPPIATVPPPADGALVIAVPNQNDTALAYQGRAFLEDLDGTVTSAADAFAWGNELAAKLFPTATDPWRAEFVRRFAVLPDDLFNALCETGTEVQSHIRIEAETKRVADGQLWYEESLPAETILSGLVWCEDRGGMKTQVLQLCEDKDGPNTLQFGGKATVGKGRTRMLFSGKGG